MTPVFAEGAESDSSAGNDSCVYDSEGNLIEDKNAAWNQDNFNVLNEKQFEYWRFKNNPPLSVQYVREEEKAMDAVFTEFDEEAVEEEED